MIAVAVLCILPVFAKKTKSLPRFIRNYPSGAVDEYHFRPGYIVVRGRLENMTSGSDKSIRFDGCNIFTEKDFVETATADGNG